MRFSEVQSELGLNFTYRTGSTGQFLMVESIGGGGGWLDYDRDGEWDLYLCQGGDPTDRAASQPCDGLFRQQPGRGFRDVTTATRVSRRAYGQGISVADFDDDGFDDLFVANYGPNSLWRNSGDGTFEDVAAEAGVDDRHWSTSTAWGDLDGDGDLDLYVANYADYDVLNPRICTGCAGVRSVCDPLEVGFQSDVCYENLGDGQFRDVTTAWGFDGTEDRSLGVVILDFDDNGRADVFVANDVTANFLYLNHGPADFRESGVVAGVAMNTAGDYQASMGVAVGDYDADGRADLYCTHFTDDSNTLYRNLGAGSFEDVTRFVGLHQPTLPYLAFGTVFDDFNSDGRLDVVIANGHIADWRSQGEKWKMRPQMFTWTGTEFVELHAEIGPYFGVDWLGRAIAKADYDRDGDMDLLVVHQDDPTVLFKERLGSRGVAAGQLYRPALESPWHRRASDRAASAGRAVQTGWLAGGTSYCAAHEPTVHFGLGDLEGPCELTVDWPSGHSQSLTGVALNQQLTVMEPDEPLVIPLR